MNDTPEQTTHESAPAPTPPMLPPIQINLPKPHGRLFTRLLGVGLITAVVIILYMGVIISSTFSGPMQSTTITEGEAEQTVAIYSIDGMINTNQANRFGTFAREVIKNDAVKAVVVRVNSPGGAVAPSDQMNAAMGRIKAAGKRLVVSMGGVAASGGYYLSAPAEVIYAEPTTITGSIGVISQMPILVGTMEKLGMQVETIRSDQAAAHKARFNPLEYPTAETIAEHTDLLNKIQTLFMAAVDRGRTSLTTEEVRELSDGRIWLGAEAKEKKLVDEIGYLCDAVDRVAAMASLSNPHVVRYELRKGLMSKLFQANSGVRLDIDLLHEIQTPRIMMIWRP